MSTIEEQIGRAATRIRPTVLSLVRGIALHKDRALEHEMKAAVDPISSPLSGEPGYYSLIERFERTAVLPRINGALVPFSSTAATVSTSPSAFWVGAGLAKPVSAAAFGTAKMDPLKAAGIAVISKELVRTSGERADAAIEAALAGAARRAVNASLLSDDAAVSTVSPGGLAAGLVAIDSTGTDDTSIFGDVLALLDGLENPVLVASLGYALRIRHAFGGAPELPVIVAPEAGDLVFAIDELAVAYSLGGLNVNASEHAAIEMSDGPSQPATLVSMFQTNSVALRVEIYANWSVINSAGVRVLSFEAS